MVFANALHPECPRQRCTPGECVALILRAEVSWRTVANRAPSYIFPLVSSRKCSSSNRIAVGAVTHLNIPFGGRFAAETRFACSLWCGEMERVSTASCCSSPAVCITVPGGPACRGGNRAHLSDYLQHSTRNPPPGFSHYRIRLGLDREDREKGKYFTRAATARSLSGGRKRNLGCGERE